MRKTGKKSALALAVLLGIMGNSAYAARTAVEFINSDGQHTGQYFYVDAGTLYTTETGNNDITAYFDVDTTAGTAVAKTGTPFGGASAGFKYFKNTDSIASWNGTVDLMGENGCSLEIFGDKSASSTKTICGYSAPTGSASNVVVTFYGGKVEAVCGASLGINCDVTNNTVNINGGQINTVMGGTSYYGNVRDNIVNINGGQINTVMGGNDHNYNSNNSTININGGIVEAVEVHSNETVNVNGGKVSAILGGNNSTIKITGGTVDHIMCGITGNNIVVNGGTVTRWIFGGRKSDIDMTSVSGNTITINDGLIGDSDDNVSVYGGYATVNTEVKNNVVNINNGSFNVENIYGGYGGNSSIVDGNTVNINNGTFSDDDFIYVYGGSATTGVVSNNIVNIDCTFNAVVYGGYSGFGNSGDATVSNNVVTINSGTIQCAYAGSSKNGDVFGNVVNFNGGKIIQYLRGGWSSTGNVSNNTLNIGGIDLTVPTVEHFQNINFRLSVITTNTTMLSVSSPLDLNNVAVGVYLQDNVNDVLNTKNLIYVNKANGTFDIVYYDKDENDTGYVEKFKNLSSQTVKFGGGYEMHLTKNLTVDAGELLGKQEVLYLDNGVVLTFSNGVLTKKLQGAGNVIFDTDMSINADNIAITGTNTVNAGKNLTFTDGTLIKKMEGLGNLIFDTNMSTNADNIAVTGTNTVNVGKTLNFIGGTLTKNITGAGESKFSNTVAVANGVNLGTNTNTVNGTLEVPENITASNINFKNGSILKVDGNNIQTTAAISGLTSATVESGAKLYIANADKDIAYKILDGSGITVDGWTESDIDFSKILTATYGLAYDKVDNDGTVFNVYFKEDVSATGGTVISNIVQAREGLLNDYITKLSDNNLGDTEKVNEGINALANMGENLNVTAGAVNMANMVGDSITEHWQNVPKQETAELRNTANDGENYIVDTVEQGKAKELMPVRVEENDGGKYVWASYIHNKNKVDGIKLGGMDGKYNAQYNGTIVGVDLTKNFGVALTYSEGNISNDFGGRNEAKYYGGSIYGRKVLGKVGVYGDITYTHAKNELQQNSVTANAKTDTVSVGLTAKYLAKACKTGNVAPFVGVRYIRIDGKEYTDSLGISREADKINSVVVPLGLEYSGEFVMPGSVWTWRPTVAVGFMFNFGDRDNDMTMKYNGATDTFGYDFVDKHTFFTRVGMEFVKKNFTLGVGYNFMKSSNSHNNKWNVNLQYSFL